MRRFSSLLLTAALAAAPLAAQQNVALYISRGITTISGVLCGFNCSSTTNTGTATANVGHIIDIRLIGDPGFPALLLASPGASIPCPGIPFPGINNVLLLNPGNVTVIAFAATVSPGGRTTCSPGGGLQLMLSSFTLPPAAMGLLVTFQGVAYDANVPTFTRAIELTVQ